MSVEIERKFLVDSGKYKELAEPVYMSQAYLTNSKEKTIRLRIAGSKAFITIKGKTSGFSRPEFEYEIPVADAKEMLELFCPTNRIEKKRYHIPHKGFTWEVDEFVGANQGLVVAEIELPSSDTTFELPNWIAKEVTGDERYFNAYLAQNPYCDWNRELQKQQPSEN